MPTTEPIFYTVPSALLFGGVSESEQEEQDFLKSLCFYLGINQIDKSETDKMKEAINNYIVNQVEDWMKEKDPVTLECIINNSFKRLCSAQSFLNGRDGRLQIHWLQVLDNHVKLIAAYSHILSLSR